MPVMAASHVSTSDGEVAAVPAHQFYSLPAELLLDIVELLPVKAFISFAFAFYPLLLSKGLAPSLSPHEVAYLAEQTEFACQSQLLLLPTELVLQVLGHLKPIDVMRMVVANYQDLARRGIAATLSAETTQRLKKLFTSSAKIEPRRQWS